MQFILNTILDFGFWIYDFGFAILDFGLQKPHAITAIPSSKSTFVLRLVLALCTPPLPRLSTSPYGYHPPTRLSLDKF
jgi:hypothetical protein